MKSVILYLLLTRKILLPFLGFLLILTLSLFYPCPTLKNDIAIVEVTIVVQPYLNTSNQCDPLTFELQPQNRRSGETLVRAGNERPSC